MCWALYLASDQELQQIPWDEVHPAFNTQELSETDLPVKKQFSLPNVICLGSHQGCGCGFMATEKADPAEEMARERTVLALSAYLDSALQFGAHLEMFLCWEDEQTEVPVAKKTLFAKDFLNPEFPLFEKEFADVAA